MFNQLSNRDISKSLPPTDDDDDEDNMPILKLSINDLKTKFTPYKVMTAMSCAGNRRKGMKEKFPEVQGNEWYVGAIGNAEYTGVLIIDLLKYSSFNIEELKDKHLVAESMDVDVT